MSSSPSRADSAAAVEREHDGRLITGPDRRVARRRLGRVMAASALVAASFCASGSALGSSSHGGAGSPTTTIITHGFSPGSKGIWVQSKAAAIIARAGGIGAVYRYQGDTGVWTAVPEAGGDGSDHNIVLIFNWVPESASVSGPNWRYTQAAGDALAAILRDPAYADETGPADLLGGRAVHFIGHSRGACVISEAIRRLALAGIAVDQMTTLDPHPVDGTLDAPYNPNWGDPTPVRWSNVAWADNYWRADGGGLINGLDFDGIPLASTLNVQLDEAALNCCAYAFAHLDVHLWYHGTIDLAPNPSDGEETISTLARDLWWPAGWMTVGHFHSVIGGGAAERPPIAPGVDPLPDSAPIIFNGSFEQGTRAGWTAHGGSPSALVNLSGNWVARLAAATPTLVHNRAFLPDAPLSLSFRVRRVDAGTTDDTLRVALQRHADAAPVAIDAATWPVSSLTTNFETVSALIPAEFGGETSRLRFVLEGGGTGVESTVDVDDIVITVLSEPRDLPGDLNGDLIVDGADLGLLLNSWGPCAGACPADLSGDGLVDGADLGLLLANWSV